MVSKKGFLSHPDSPKRSSRWRSSLVGAATQLLFDTEKRPFRRYLGDWRSNTGVSYRAVVNRSGRFAGYVRVPAKVRMSKKKRIALRRAAR